MSAELSDVAVVGAGAAGLATAIFAARANPRLRVVLLDGAVKPGAKILVSGGGRCNVTNTKVTPEDFRGGSRNSIRRVLANLPVPETIAFFREIGVSLHEEEHGKLFPDSNRARTVLEALLAEAQRCGVMFEFGRRVQAVDRHGDEFIVRTDDESFAGRCVALATGGMSLPKTGSDGGGYDFARKLGHSLVPPTPALAPLILDGSFHGPLSGVSQEVEIVIRIEDEKLVRLAGSLLWTHFGISGPVALNASGYWHRAQLDGRSVRTSANLLPGMSFGSADEWLLEETARRSKATLVTIVAEKMPARVAEAVLSKLCIGPHLPMAHLSREDRRRLVNAMLEWPLPVVGSRGYNYAEVTSGGVPLSEINPTTMESRICRGLYLVGEILDVDGRIGGFNFQWAWSSGKAAGEALGQSCDILRE